jgi:hypothetical protein
LPAIPGLTDAGEKYKKNAVKYNGFYQSLPAIMQTLIRHDTNAQMVIALDMASSFHDRMFILSPTENDVNEDQYHRRIVDLVKTPETMVTLLKTFNNNSRKSKISQKSIDECKLLLYAAQTCTEMMSLEDTGLPTDLGVASGMHGICIDAANEAQMIRQMEQFLSPILAPLIRDGRQFCVVGQSPPVLLCGIQGCAYIQSCQLSFSDLFDPELTVGELDKFLNPTRLLPSSGFTPNNRVPLAEIGLILKELCKNARDANKIRRIEVITID